MNPKQHSNVRIRNEADNASDADRSDKTSGPGFDAEMTEAERKRVLLLTMKMMLDDPYVRNKHMHRVIAEEVPSLRNLTVREYHAHFPLHVKRSIANRSPTTCRPCTWGAKHLAVFARILARYDRTAARALLVLHPGVKRYLPGPFHFGLWYGVRSEPELAGRLLNSEQLKDVSDGIVADGVGVKVILQALQCEDPDVRARALRMLEFVEPDE